MTITTFRAVLRHGCRALAFAVCVALSGLLAHGAARAQDGAESFYKGRLITILIGFPPGGSYDMYARLTSAHLGKFISGNPSFVVQNKPAGGIGVLRSFYETAPRDGTTVGIFPETVAIVQLTQPDVGRWKVQDMRYIGSFSDVNSIFLLRAGAPAKTVAEMQKTPITVGCNNPLGQAYINPTILKKLAGFPFHIVCGYPGNNALPVALTRGEIDMTSGAWSGWKNRAEVLSGEFKPVIQAGLKRHRELPDVPLMQELVDNARARSIIEFLTAGSAIGRALIAPPGVAADRIAVLRSAFDRMVKDPDFLEQARLANIELDPSPGREVDEISNAILATPAPIVQAAIEASK